MLKVTYCYYFSIIQKIFTPSGSVSIDGNNVIFTPYLSFNGTASFSYSISDGYLTSSATVSVPVSCSSDYHNIFGTCVINNRAPVASTQSISTDEDTSKQINLSANDADVDSLNYSIVSNPTHGTLSGTATNITYTPDLNYHGLDSFTFKANDGTVDSNIAIVLITVSPINDQPTLSEINSLTILEDAGSQTVFLTGISSGDANESETITVSAVSNNTSIVSNPTVSYSSPNYNGTLNFNPVSNANGVATITVTVNDGKSSNNLVTKEFSIIVNPVNDSPVAVNDAISSLATAGSSLSVSSSTLLSNDSDIDNDIISVVSVSSPSTGSVSISGGNILFTPAVTFNGTATFSYLVTDGFLTSSATVSVQVSCASGYYNSGNNVCSLNPQITSSNMIYDQLSLGGVATCILDISGTVFCRGQNLYGQLGNGTGIDSTAEVEVAGLNSNIVSISSMDRRSCAVTSSGGVKCWGYNNFGQLGDGTTTQRTTPVDVSGLTSGVVAVSAGNDHSCAVTSSGGVKCWGYNAFGQLGNNSTTDRYTPVSVLASSGIERYYGLERKGIQIFGTCNGSSTINHSPSSNTITPVSTQCQGGVFNLKLSSTVMDNILNEINSRFVKIYETIGSITSGLSSNSSVGWPLVIDYQSSSSLTFTQNLAITPLVPYISGGPVTSWSVSPPFPQGLSINQENGVISGTPTTTSSLSSYVVTASNSTGSASKSLSISVIENLVYPTLSVINNTSDVGHTNLVIHFDRPVKIPNFINKIDINGYTSQNSTQYNGTPWNVETYSNGYLYQANTYGFSGVQYTLLIDPFVNPGLSFSLNNATPFDFNNEYHSDYTIVLGGGLARVSNSIKILKGFGIAADGAMTAESSVATGVVNYHAGEF